LKALSTLLIVFLTSCTSNLKTSDSSVSPQEESLLWNLVNPSIKIGDGLAEIEKTKNLIRERKKIALMTIVPDSFCHINMVEKYANWTYTELGFEGSVSKYFNNLFSQELSKKGYSVDLFDPIEYFGNDKPFFMKSYKTKDGLRSTPEIKSQHKEKLEQLLHKNKAAALVLLYVNESTHGKNYQDECYGIRFVTKTLATERTNYIHSPTWFIYSLNTGQKVDKISVKITDGVEMPNTSGELPQDYTKRILQLIEKEFRKAVIKKL